MSTATLDRPRKRNRPLAAHRKAKAVELAIQGYKYDDIAREVGYANRGTAYRVVRQAMEEAIAVNVEQLRETEVARLDALQAAVWPAAMAGDLDAVEQVRAIIDRRARLLGLYPVGKHKPEQPLRPVTVIVPEGWTRRADGTWDFTAGALRAQQERQGSHRR